MYTFVYLFISLFIYLFIGLLREKGLDIGRRPLQLSLLQWFISARFPTLQTITGTRLHVLSLTDVLCTHVGTLQVISL